MLTRYSSKVFKYSSPIRDEFILTLPEGAEIVHVQVQTSNDRHSGKESFVQIWALVPAATVPVVNRFFKVFGTGYLISAGLEWIATFLDGPFVWHLFEVKVL